MYVCMYVWLYGCMYGWKNRYFSFKVIRKAKMYAFFSLIAFGIEGLEKDSDNFVVSKLMLG